MTLDACIPVPAGRLRLGSRTRAVSRVAALLAACALATLTLSACGPAEPQLKAVTATGASYTTEQVETAANATALGAAGSVTKEKGPGERQRALAQLRLSGTEGVRTADLLTKLFPANTAAVPVSIERAKVNGVDALIVVEAAPGKGEALTTRRVWVLDYRDGGVMDSASFR